MKGDAEHHALTAALEVNDPGCLNDPRYILDADELTADDMAGMKATCRTCPVADYCALYGAAAKPPAGMWAGRQYPPSQRRTPKGRPHDPTESDSAQPTQYDHTEGEQ